jgi:hypothetical protein
MSYILNKTNGSIVTTVADASIDRTTDLIFVGRNYAGYGEIQNENFLKLLENFANTTPPTKPIEGQVWYDTTNKQINFYDTDNWKSLANLDVNTANPLNSSRTPSAGDLWYHKTEQQLFVYNGSEYVLIGPPIGADTKAGWRGSYEEVIGAPNIPIYNIKATIGNEVVATVSDQEYALGGGSGPYPIYVTGAVLHKGINLTGADPITGSSEAEGYYFWGSASHSLYANTATVAERVLYTESNTPAEYPVSFYSTSTVSAEANVNYGFTYNPALNTVKASFFDGIATSAYYADLAERYEADAVYEPGTVVVLGGEKEVTIDGTHANTAVAGIVSKNPAYMMNSGAGTDETHPYIALKGRVPCKVVGYIKKGDLLVTSTYPGYATKATYSADATAVIAKAIGSQLDGFGIIEVMVV